MYSLFIRGFFLLTAISIFSPLSRNLLAEECAYTRQIPATGEVRGNLISADASCNQIGQKICEEIFKGIFKGAKRQSQEEVLCGSLQVKKCFQVTCTAYCEVPFICQNQPDSDRYSLEEEQIWSMLTE